MKRKGQNIIGGLIGLILLLTACLPLALSVVNAATTLSLTNENSTAAVGETTYTLSQGTNTPSSLTLNNGTALVENTDYLFHSANGTIEYLTCAANQTGCDNNVAAEYNYEDAGYVSSGPTRVILTVIPIFIAIAAIGLVTTAF